MKLFVQKIGFVLLLFLAVNAKSQVKFSASADPEIIGRNEYTTLRFVLENAGNIQQISPPAFNDFTILSGPLQESGMSNINGKVSNYVAISFVVQPKSTGTFTLSGAVAKVDGRNYRSNPLKIIVDKKSHGQNPSAMQQVPGFFDEPKPMSSFSDYIFKNGENVQDKVDKNMHLRLEVSKTSCYVGEPIVATYKLYTRLKSESKLTQNPSFNGFSVIDLQPADVTQTAVEKLNGREYNVYTLRKAQLYPLQDGNISLETAELENKVQFIKESYAKNNA